MRDTFLNIDNNRFLGKEKPQHTISFFSKWLDRRSALLGDIFADFLPPNAFLESKAQAKEAGVPLLDAVLARADAPVEAMVRRLAKRAHIGIYSKQDIDFKNENISFSEASLALRSGILRLEDGRFIIAARGKAIERSLPLLRRHEGNLREKFFLASPRDFAALVMHIGGFYLAQHAENTIENLDKILSARSTSLIRWVALGMTATIGYSLFLGSFPTAISICFSFIFIVLAAVRFYACGGFLHKKQHALSERTADYDLPVYTLLIPLFKEARVVDKLVKAIASLDYPAAKLDIKFLVEKEDVITQEALTNASLSGNTEVLIITEGNVRTKPRALNVGLAAARGKYIAVYDAEDEPDKGQLRAAVTAFQNGDNTLACVQGQLCIDNTHDGWLTKHFTLEYAALFELLLPALARLKVLFPLGGTSNHFKVSALRECGGWDAYNVTEDADLGVRLARMGYTLDVITSPTWEEAPNRGISWLTQRTRWMKGYMITWGVHMCTPRVLLHQLGWKNFLIFQGFIAGIPLTALIFPVFVILGITGLFREDSAFVSFALSNMLALITLIAGFAAAIAIVATALLKRSLWTLWHVPFTLFFYWLLIGLAAWRALLQLLYAPHFWEKTDHGYARTSRLKSMRSETER